MEQKDSERDQGDATKQSHWGFRGKTVWNWLELLIVPVALAVVGLWFTAQQEARQQEIESKRAEAARNLEEQVTQDEALQAYLDQMSALLLEKDLRASDQDGEVRTLARARTLTVLERLDPDRKSTVVGFLYEADLIEADSPVVPLISADLRDANLSTMNLEGANLSGADLSGSNLTWAHLPHANLSDAVIEDANLTRAFMMDVNFTQANLSNADLSAYLWNAHFEHADLDGADLSNANLGNADQLDPYSLAEARSLKGSLMPNGQDYKEWLKSNEGQKYQDLRNS